MDLTVNQHITNQTLDNQTPAEDTPANQTPANQSDQAAARKRGKKWTVPEEEQLAISWLVISEDPEHTNNQSGTDFYIKVAEHFAKAFPNAKEPRTGEQIKNHWKPINTATLKFSSIYGEIQRNPPSGHAPSDYMTIAKKEYLNRTKENFKNEPSWQILRYAPKWTQAANGKTASSNPGVSGVSSPQTAESTIPNESSNLNERPVGQKKAKRQREDREIESERIKELKRATDIQERKAIVLEKGHELAERALKVQEEAKDLKTLMASLDSCPDEESREILRLMKAKLLRQYREEEGDNNDD